MSHSVNPPAAALTAERLQEFRDFYLSDKYSGGDEIGDAIVGLLGTIANRDEQLAEAVAIGIRLTQERDDAEEQLAAQAKRIDAVLRLRPYVATYIEYEDGTGYRSANIRVLPVDDILAALEPPDAEPRERRKKCRSCGISHQPYPCHIPVEDLRPKTVDAAAAMYAKTSGGHKSKIRAALKVARGIHESVEPPDVFTEVGEQMDKILNGSVPTGRDYCPRCDEWGHKTSECLRADAAIKAPRERVTDAIIRKAVARFQELTMCSVPGSFSFSDYGERWLAEATEYALESDGGKG